MNFDKSFFRTVLREADGTASASRMLTAAIVAASIAWVTFLIVSTKTMPDLKSVGEFICTTALSLYGVNRVTAAASNIFSKPENCDKPA